MKIKKSTWTYAVIPMLMLVSKVARTVTWCWDESCSGLQPTSFTLTCSTDVSGVYGSDALKVCTPADPSPCASGQSQRSYCTTTPSSYQSLFCNVGASTAACSTSGRH